MGKKKHQNVALIIDNKAMHCSRKMALATIELVKKSFEEKNENAIVAVQKFDIYTLLKDVYASYEELDKAVREWESAGFVCYHTSKRGK